MQSVYSSNDVQRSGFQHISFHVINRPQEIRQTPLFLVFSVCFLDEIILTRPSRMNQQQQQQKKTAEIKKEAQKSEAETHNNRGAIDNLCHG